MPAPVPRRSFTVVPEWIDANGHMNMGFYVVAFDLVATDPFYDWLDIGEQYITRERMSVYTLSSSTDYLGELHEGDTGSIDTLLLDHDHKRLHYIHCMSDSAGTLVATNELLGINVDLETRRSADFPAEAQDRIGALMSAHTDVAPPAQVGRRIGIRR